MKIAYWILLILFCLAMLGDAYGGISHQQEGVDALNSLGFPLYLLTFMGVLKIFGVIALLQPKFKTIKEWAFAGFAFNFIGAIWARATMTPTPAMLLPPLIMLVYLFVVYFFWRRLSR